MLGRIRRFFADGQLQCWLDGDDAQRLLNSCQSLVFHHPWVDQKRTACLWCHNRPMFMVSFNDSEKVGPRNY